MWRFPWIEQVWPGDPDRLLERRRAEAIVSRIRALALTFAALTVAWIGVDALLFESPVWTALAPWRLAAATLLVLIAWRWSASPARRVEARIRLAALFLVPAYFFVAATQVLAELPRTGVDAGVLALYDFIPFLMVVGIAAFPLAVAEAAAIAVVPLAAQAWAIAVHGPPVLDWDLLHAEWLLVLLAGAATYAAVSQRNLMAALVAQALRDPLTGCHRRENGLELLEMQLKLARRMGEPFALLFADIDHFKRVNDEFGHEAGDAVLARVATAMRAQLRESDTLLRWGGEEFVALLPGADNEEAVRLIERLRHSGLGRDPAGRAMTLSVGVASWPRDGSESAQGLIELADQRMYRAKRAGRNRYVRSAAEEAVPILATGAD